MSDAEIKLQLIRIIDGQKRSTLEILYDYMIQKMGLVEMDDLEMGYKAMSEDVVREKGAEEWINGTLNTADI